MRYDDSHATVIIETLLEYARECNNPFGKRVSFTISDLSKNMVAELQAKQFFTERFNVELECGGKKNDRHFSFVLMPEMKQKIRVPYIPPPSRRHTKSRPVANQLSFA